MTVNTTAPWWTTAVVYQIYVRSFADANGDGVGDLDGIRSRLEYLAALGVDAIWLTPCYPSPQHDHGYDVADYFDIEPAYGDLAAFDALVDEARRHRLRVLMDIVPNHCSWDHPWFRAALTAAPGSPERERFWFRDGRGPNGDQPPNNWVSAFGGIAWSRVEDADGNVGQWYHHHFAAQQPDWNWGHPEVLDHFERVLRFWLDRGVDGFRIDAPVPIGKAPGLPDGPISEGGGPDDLRKYNPHTMFRPEGHAVWRQWRSMLDDYERDHPGRMITMVAETYSPDRPDLAAEYVRPDEFHQAFSFDLMLAPWNAHAVGAALRDIVATRPELARNTAWALNNHDMQRSVTRYGRADAATAAFATPTRGRDAQVVDIDLALGVRRARAALALMLGLPGSAYVYQGEELGLPEVLDLPDAARQDPAFFRTSGADLGRDGCRVPIPWTVDIDTSFGFSESTPASSAWMPQPPGWGRYAASEQRGGEATMLAFYTHAIAARRRLVDAAGAAFAIVDDVPDDVVAFRRGDWLVATNLGSSRRPLSMALVGDRSIAFSSAGDGHCAEELPADTTVWLAPR